MAYIPQNVYPYESFFSHNLAVFFGSSERRAARNTEASIDRSVLAACQHPHCLHRVRRQWQLRLQSAALEQQGKLTHGQRHHPFTPPTPQRGEAPVLESFLKNTQPGAVPHQHLGRCPSPVYEQVAVPALRIFAQPLLDQARQAVISLAKIGRRWVGQHSQIARAPDHGRSAHLRKY